MYRLLILFLAVAATCGSARAQDDQPYTLLNTYGNAYWNSAWYVSPTDTLAMATFAPVMIDGYSTNRQKKKQYDRMQQKVIKVYPYARMAGDVMRMYEALCLAETDPKKQKELLDQAEEEMKEQFEMDLRKMTVSEGIILIKLIDRETGNTSYGLVQELKGKLSAFMWQGVARLFGHNLKDDYDPYGEDVWIEGVVQEIEFGIIPVELKEVDPFGIKTALR